MFYRYSLTVPASTAQSAPVETIMRLTYGIVHQVEIGFPPGCAALVHVSIHRYEHQAWPTNPDEQFAWDDYNVRITGEEFPLLAAPFTLYLRAWSEDTSYAHTITARIGLKIPLPQRPGSWIKRLLQGETAAKI